MVPVGLVMVELVDSNNHRDAVLVCITGEKGCSNLNSGCAVHDHNRAVDNLEG